MAPSVSIVIPVLNDSQALLTCLRALSRQTFERRAFEVLVVDNGSRPPVGNLATDFPFVRVLREEKPGSYAARNRAVIDAQGAVVGFTDADCVPESDWIEQGVAAILRLGDGMVGGPIEITVDDPSKPKAAELYEVIFGFPQATYIQSGFAATANLFTSRDTLARVGAFDERFKSGGDAEWGQRLRAMGLAQVYSDPVRVRHPARRTVTALLRKVVRVASGGQQLAEHRHEGTQGLRQYAWRQIVKLTRIRANISNPWLDGFGRKVRFGALVWTVDVVRTAVRYSIHVKFITARVRATVLGVRNAG